MTSPAAAPSTSLPAHAQARPGVAGGSAPVDGAASLARIENSGRFSLDDIPLLASLFAKYDQARGTPWDRVRHAHLQTPDWFRTDLDALSPDHERQQHRLWAAVAGVDEPYSPDRHEKEAAWQGDPLRFPGVFVRRDPEAVDVAADHLLATGMILKYSGLKPGATALEYGAGFAQTALQMARLGVRVDTVDISPELCKAVQTQASFFGVPLTPFEGRFGWNPRAGHQYDLIWFYESFHHCLDFKAVVHQLSEHLVPGGRVLLAGEPVVREPDRDVPYDWGLRQGSEVIATVRLRHWFELGFTEDFLVGLFTAAGFAAAHMACPMSRYGEGYVFQRRGPTVELAKTWLPHALARQWHHPEPDGRWSTGESSLLVDTTDSFSRLALEMSNHHPCARTVAITYGGREYEVTLDRGERKEVVLAASTKTPRLTLRTATLVPADDYRPAVADSRALGVFVHCLSYR